jgi:SPP1 family phage portal protein
MVKPESVIPIYNYDIEPQLGAVIRFYKQDNKIIIIVYYSDLKYTYEKNENNKQKKSGLKLIKEPEINLYKQPPFVIYENNEEMIGEINPIKKLISAYDILASDSMNEFDRFAWAYLLMTDQISIEDAKQIKTKRIFENLDSTDAIKFLTKDIPHEYIKFMREWIKSEIHEQSHVPDFANIRTGGNNELSGVALDRLLYDFEFIAATKEVYFKKGLYDRFKMIDKIINVSDSSFISNDIEIEMKRNKPGDKKTDAEIYNLYYQKGITEETLMQYFATFVEDPEKEIEKFKKENEEETIEIPGGIPSEIPGSVSFEKDLV